MADQLELTLPPPAPLAETINGLRRLVPGAFVEGQLDPERLLTLLGVAEVDAEAERYRFQWSGRAEAAASLKALPSGALVPDRGASVGFDDAEHVIIEGDNLEVLKLL